MNRTGPEIATFEYKLGKRGFLRDPRPIDCRSCEQRAVFIYAIKHTNIGGRSIEWCHHCDEQRGFTRPGGGDRVEDDHFDIERFLA